MQVRASLHLEAKQKLYPIITQLREKETGIREFLGEMDESGSAPETRLFIVSNRRPSSQAGSRGFDPRLPLLIFQVLTAFQIRVQPNAAHSFLVDQNSSVLTCASPKPHLIGKQLILQINDCRLVFAMLNAL